MNRRIRAVALGATTLLVSTVAVSVPASAQDEGSPFVEHEVIASGLNNPRQLDQGYGGTLLVAEAGRGGDQCFGEGEAAICLGKTGAVTRISSLKHNPVSEKLVTGLMSGAGPDGSFAGGPAGVEDNTNGDILISFMGGVPPLPGADLSQMGKLLRFHERKAPLSSKLSTLADISAVETAYNNPDGYVDPQSGPELDSNPYGVLALNDGRTIVADAAGNDLIEVQPDGTAKPWLVLPQYGNEGDRQPTPTSLTLGGDGYIYVGTLAHEEFGAARIWKISQDGHIVGFIGADEGALVRTDRGLTTLVGIDVARNGDIFVSELFNGPDPEGIPGYLTRIDARTGATSSVAVPFPGGVAIGKDQKLYVSAFSIATADGMGIPGMDSSGQVWRVPLTAFDEASAPPALR
jgi:hypothetical protein